MAIMGWTSPLDPEVARIIFIFPFSFIGCNLTKDTMKV
jgi:hypothetical protein